MNPRDIVEVIVFFIFLAASFYCIWILLEEIWYTKTTMEARKEILKIEISYLNTPHLECCRRCKNTYVVPKDKRGLLIVDNPLAYMCDTCRLNYLKTESE